MFSFWVFLLLSICIFLNTQVLLGQVSGTGTGWQCVTGRPWETDVPRHIEPVAKTPSRGYVQTPIGAPDLVSGKIIHHMNRVDSFGKSTGSSELFYWLRYNVFCWFFSAVNAEPCAYTPGEMP